MFKRRQPEDGIQVYDGQGQEPLSVQQRKARRQNKMKTWPAGNWRYVAKFEDDRGHLVRFCYSLHRNEAGYFFAWREVRVPKDSKPTANPLFTVHTVEAGGVQWLLKRYDVVGRRQKFRAKAFAMRKAAEWPKFVEARRKEKADFQKREAERKARQAVAKAEAERAVIDLIGKPKKRAKA